MEGRKVTWKDVHIRMDVRIGWVDGMEIRIDG